MEGALTLFIPDELLEISFPDKLSGSCGVTSDQLGQKSYVEMQIGKQWKVVPLSRFLKIPLRVILQNRLQGKHPWNPLNSIVDTGCTILPLFLPGTNTIVCKNYLGTSSMVKH